MIGRLHTGQDEIRGLTPGERGQRSGDGDRIGPLERLAPERPEPGRPAREDLGLLREDVGSERMIAGLARFDFTLIEAARTLGCTYPGSVLRVMVPAGVMRPI